jgi:hypothetical protein
LMFFIRKPAVRSVPETSRILIRFKLKSLKNIFKIFSKSGLTNEVSGIIIVLLIRETVEKEE